MPKEPDEDGRKGAREWLTPAVAVVAVALSLLSFLEARRANDQARQANRESRRQAEREQASRIDFIAWNQGGVESLSIADHTRSLITDVTLGFRPGHGNPKG
ncbi:hypothetical protein [Streptomyces roseolilacinus]|uniref:Uncharacterized protein n=1 Tax=Streptomyces roseolilacinus TaxID=66904 RepID=A0A918EMB3_9ACTN|nr:hypothetical protein [Streptomyces roseolilacinus]GGQ22005.1 hypothetical protein GCM10010249_46000 [Streptomyces roseolilacinus]